MKPFMTREEVSKLNPSDDLPIDISHLSKEEQAELEKERKECIKILNDLLSWTESLKVKHG